MDSLEDNVVVEIISRDAEEITDETVGVVRTSMIPLVVGADIKIETRRLIKIKMIVLFKIFKSIFNKSK